VEEEYFSTSCMQGLLTDAGVPPQSPVDGGGFSLYKWGFFSMGQEMPDIYNFIDGIVVPVLFNNASSSSPAVVVRSDTTGRLQRVFRGDLVPIGALRLRTKHVRRGTCQGLAAAYGAGGEKDLCYAHGVSEDTENRDVLQYRDPVSASKDGNPFQYSYAGCEASFAEFFGLIQSYSCGGFIVDVPFNLSYGAAQNVTKTLRSDRFCYAPSLRLFSLEFFAFHLSTKSYVFVNLVAELASTGGFLQQSLSTPFVSARSQAHWIGLAVTTLLFVLFFLSRFIRDWRRDFRQTRSVINFLLDLWNFLDIVNYLVFFAFCVFYFMWWDVSKSFEQQHPDLGNFQGEFPAKLVDIKNTFVLTRKINAFNFLLIFLKFLKFLRLNDRVNILTRTLKSAARSILTIIATFSIVVLAYALAANTFYGGDLFSFRNVNNSWASLFRLLIGDFDYDAMRAVNQDVTFVFFWSFVILGLFIFLNMLIAVIMDSFSEEQKTTESLAAAFQRWVDAFSKALQDLTLGGMVTAVAESIASTARNVVSGYVQPERKALWAMEKWHKEQLQLVLASEPSLTFSKAQRKLDFRDITPHDILDWYAAEVKKREGYSSNNNSSSNQATNETDGLVENEFNVVWGKMVEEHELSSAELDDARLSEMEQRVLRGSAQAIADVLLVGLDPNTNNSSGAVTSGANVLTLPSSPQTSTGGQQQQPTPFAIEEIRKVQQGVERLIAMLQDDENAYVDSSSSASSETGEDGGGNGSASPDREEIVGNFNRH
jgi:hypothetical protein